MGLCLGAQLLGKAYGGEVGPHPEGLNEIGYADIAPTQAGRELIPGPMRVFHWHTEGVETPPGGERLAEGAVFPNQAFRLGAHAYGLQFHPETTVEIFSTWIEEAGHMLDWPGAQPKDAIFADAERHDARTGAMAGRIRPGSWGERTGSLSPPKLIPVLLWEEGRGEERRIAAAPSSP